jgi:hypothetical protein
MLFLKAISLFVILVVIGFIPAPGYPWNMTEWNSMYRSLTEKYSERIALMMIGGGAAVMGVLYYLKLAGA